MTLSSKWPVWQMASVTASNPRLKMITSKNNVTDIVWSHKSHLWGEVMRRRFRIPPSKSSSSPCLSSPLQLTIFSHAFPTSLKRWTSYPLLSPQSLSPPSISLNHFNSAWRCISFSPQLVSCGNFTNWLRVIKLCPILPIATKRDGVA